MSSSSRSVPALWRAAAVSPDPAWHAHSSRRSFALKSGFKYNMLQQRATEQHVDYMRQRAPPRPYRQVPVLDPKLQKAGLQETQLIFQHPELTRQPTEAELHRDTRLKELEMLRSKLEAPWQMLSQVDFKPFGCIDVFSGDLFKMEAQSFGKQQEQLEQRGALLLPLPDNLTPYRGLGLEIFNRGGRPLINAVFEAGTRVPMGPGSQKPHFSAPSGTNLRSYGVL